VLLPHDGARGGRLARRDAQTDARSAQVVISTYEDVDIKRIRAVRVSCPGARRVARRAHRKALGITPPPSGVRRFEWNGWQVTGDLRGANDRYVAKRAAKRVRWLF
jgi:hypothetical protein